MCEPDRTRIGEQLAGIPVRLAALTLRLAPGSAPAGPKVHTSRTGSPPGARLDALTLLGPGADYLSAAAVAAMMLPRIRRWRTETTVTVTVGGRVEERRVVDWHQELVRDETGQPVRFLADDQVGVLPPVEWLDLWARSWRSSLGHHTPPLRAPARERDTPRTLGGRDAAAMLLGLRGYQPPRERPDDPLEQEWVTRFGATGAPHGVISNIRYLLTWLDVACDRDLGIREFASELRALNAELAWGNDPDQQWLGRCPTQLTDRVTGQTSTCGSHLWHDPYVSDIGCVRCHSTWTTRGRQALQLAADIRRRWPLDRRRMYTAADRAQCPTILTCDGCGSPISVTWARNPTGPHTEPTWTPTAAACPSGCPDPERMLG